MRRRGFVLWEFVVALVLMGVLVPFLFPFIRIFVMSEYTLLGRGQVLEQGLWVTDWMVEKARNSLSRTRIPQAANRYVYYETTMYGSRGRYSMRFDNGAVQVVLYTGGVQPITGGSKGMGDVRAVPLSSKPVFHVKRHGLVHLDFGLVRPKGEASYEVHTAILPYHDFYKGETYDSS